MSNSHGKIIFLVGIFLASKELFAQSQIDVPVCPKYITVKNHIVDVPKGWQADMASRFNRKPQKFVLKDGQHLTRRRMPEVTLIVESREQKIIPISPDEENITKENLEFTWEIEAGERWVYICDSESDIFLYRDVESGVSSCTLTINLIKGQRTWADQKLECEKRKIAK